jgi:hypothetical protein
MKRQGKPKGQTTVFKTHHKDTIDGISTKITSYIPNGLTSFTIDLTAHWLYVGTDNVFEVLTRLDKHLERRVGTYLRENQEFAFIIIDCDYPTIGFTQRTSFVEVQITAARRVKVSDYDAVAKQLLTLRDYVVDIIKQEEFTFNERKIKKS